MTTLDFDSDQFLQLVSDALRAGPQSPAWRQAISELMIMDVQGTGIAKSGGLRMDEYRLLFTARQHLEDGKGFRRIHAGPQFTQKVMEAVAQESKSGFGAAGGKFLSTANLIMAGVAVLVFGAVAVIGWSVWGGTSRQSLTDLQAQTFSQDVISATFDGNPMAGWKTLGHWPLSNDGALRPSSAFADGGYMGCGIVTSAALPADEPAQIQARIQLPASGDTVVQVFVSDDPNFSNRAISPHEVVFSIQPAAGKMSNGGKPALVLPDGTFAATGQVRANPADAIVLRLAFNSDYVVAESDGRQLYAGPHQLVHNKPRYVGVRFLCGVGDQPAVLSVRVSKG